MIYVKPFVQKSSHAQLMDGVKINAKKKNSVCCRFQTEVVINVAASSKNYEGFTNYKLSRSFVLLGPWLPVLTVAMLRGFLAVIKFLASGGCLHFSRPNQRIL